MNPFQIIRTTSDDAEFLAALSVLDINEQDEDSGDTLLHHALVYRRPSLVMALLAAGCDINRQENMGSTALHYAVEMGFPDIAQELISRGADINITNNYGNAPLWTAVFNAKGHYEIVTAMLQHGANPNLKNKAGRSPLDFAIQIGDRELIKLLEGSAGRP